MRMYVMTLLLQTGHKFVDFFGFNNIIPNTIKYLLSIIGFWIACDNKIMSNLLQTRF